jgi:hypothetical protein
VGVKCLHRNFFIKENTNRELLFIARFTATAENLPPEDYAPLGALLGNYQQKISIEAEGLRKKRFTIKICRILLKDYLGEITHRYRITSG